MARTRQTASKSTGGRPPKVQLGYKASRKRVAVVVREPEPSFRVWNICDRKEYSGRLYYKVRWYGKWADTWEPRKWMLDQGFKDDIQVVDDWKSSKIDDFYQYCNQEKIAVGSDADGRCFFRAMSLALTAMGEPSWLTDDMVNRFYDISREKGFPISSNGIKVNDLFAFCRYLNTQNPTMEVSIKDFKRNLLVDSVRSGEALNAFSLDDGIFICAGFSSNRRGHAFLLEVERGIKLASDNESHRMPLVKYADWAVGFLYVRRIILNKK